MHTSFRTSSLEAGPELEGPPSYATEVPGVLPSTAGPVFAVPGALRRLLPQAQILIRVGGCRGRGS